MIISKNSVFKGIFLFIWAIVAIVILAVCMSSPDIVFKILGCILCLGSAFGIYKLFKK
jgi:hypothetical protein